MKKLRKAGLFIGVIVIVMNILRYGTAYKALNILALSVIGISIYSLISKEKVKSRDMDIFKFGWLWLLGVLMIPVLMILTLKGY